MTMKNSLFHFHYLYRIRAILAISFGLVAIFTNRTDFQEVNANGHILKIVILAIPDQFLHLLDGLHRRCSSRGVIKIPEFFCHLGCKVRL
jgi:hypothetical protein